MQSTSDNQICCHVMSTTFYLHDGVPQLYHKVSVCALTVTAFYLHPAKVLVHNKNTYTVHAWPHGQFHSVTQTYKAPPVSKGIGLCADWLDAATQAARQCSGPTHPIIYLMTTDMGPDQAKCARLLAERLVKEPQLIFFHSPCFLHQIHLTVRFSLSKFPSYFSSCAKIVNVWRSWGNSRKIRATWKDLYGEKRCKEATSRLPPRPLQGRWGSIEGIEGFLLRCRREELIKVYECALLKKAKSLISEGEKKQSSDLDDEVRKFQLEVGRWTIEAIEALKDDTFWGSLIIGSVSRGPLNHTMNFLMKENKENCKGEDRHLTVVNFITSLVPRVEIDFDYILASPKPWYELHTLDGVKTLFNKATFATLLSYADFNRRIACKTKVFPLKLVWLLHRPDAMCNKRKEIASDVLDLSATVGSSPDSLPANTPVAKVMEKLVEQHIAKVGILLGEEFQYSKDTGLLHPRLKTFLEHLFNVMSLDTQSVEGLNSVIKLMCRAAPNLHLPLLSSRLNIKTFVREHASTSAERAALLDEAVEYHERTKQWMVEDADPHRWGLVLSDQTAEALPLQDQDGIKYYRTASKGPGTRPRKPHSEEMCHAKMLLLLQTATQRIGYQLKPADGICFCFVTVVVPTLKGTQQDDALMLTERKISYIGVPTMLDYSRLFWAQCAFASEGDRYECDGQLGPKDLPVIKIKTPVAHVDSLDVMKILHDMFIHNCDRIVGVDVELWVVQWGQEGCVGQAVVVDRKPLKCNLVQVCKCVGSCNRKLRKGEQMTFATDEEIIEGLADELLRGMANDDQQEWDNGEEVPSSATGDADIQRLLEQATSVCRPPPQGFFGA